MLHIVTETDPWNTEVFVYDNGMLTQLTDNEVGDKFPDINDEGTIVWNRGSSPDEQVVMLRDGQLTILAEGSVG